MGPCKSEIRANELSNFLVYARQNEMHACLSLVLNIFMRCSSKLQFEELFKTFVHWRKKIKMHHWQARIRHISQWTPTFSLKFIHLPVMFPFSSQRCQKRIILLFSSRGKTTKYFYTCTIPLEDQYVSCTLYVKKTKKKNVQASKNLNTCILTEHLDERFFFML